MALTPEFGPKDIYAQIERTGIQGRHLNFIDDLSSDDH